MWVKNNEVIIFNDLKIFWFFGFRTPVSQSVATWFFLEFWWENCLMIFLLYQRRVSVMFGCQGREGDGIIWHGNLSIRLQRCSHWESWQDKLNIKREIKFLTILREPWDDNNAEGASQSQQSHRFSTILFYSITSLSYRNENQKPWKFDPLLFMSSPPLSHHQSVRLLDYRVFCLAH